MLQLKKNCDGMKKLYHIISRKGGYGLKCKDIVDILDQLSPQNYACEWDNIGLLLGRKEKDIKNVMIALDVTKDVIEQAIIKKVDLLITHHPMIFSSLKQINEDHVVSEKVLSLAEHGIAYYAMHTNFDTIGGMGDLVAGKDYLDLKDVTPIVTTKDPEVGMGRYGMLPKPMTSKQLAEYVKEKFQIPFVMLYQRKQDENKVYDKIAVLPGSGKSEMKKVIENGYSLYLTGDFGHHEGLDAMDMGLTVMDATHYGLEHVFITFIARYLKQKMDNMDIHIMEVDLGCPIEIL